MASKNKKYRINQSARYTVHIPTHDEHGNLLHDLGPVGWQWLTDKIPNMIHHIHSEGPYAGHKGTFRHLKVLGYDTPETDSHVKQLACHVGNACNHPHISVVKENGEGAAPWVISNRTYAPGYPAPNESINFQLAENPGQAGISLEDPYMNLG